MESYVARMDRFWNTSISGTMGALGAVVVDNSLLHLPLLLSELTAV